jgi:hypothetical protein
MRNSTEDPPSINKILQKRNNDNLVMEELFKDEMLKKHCFSLCIY